MKKYFYLGCCFIFIVACNNAQKKTTLPVAIAEKSIKDSIVFPYQALYSSSFKLFEKDKGAYLAAAASKGQVAACNKIEGGFFTFSFFQFLESAFEAGNTGLGGIIDRAAEFASLRSGRAICGDKPCMQNALSRIVA
jgi:hypothetical protein